MSSHRMFASLLFFISCVFLVTQVTGSLLYSFETISSSDKDQELKSIEIELADINVKLSQYRHGASNAEVNAQPDMINHWHEFAENIREAEKDEKEIHTLKERKKLLLQRKEALFLKN